jgi:hypothetical protein
MGYIVHHAIIITTWNGSRAETVADMATSMGLQVLGPSERVVNRYRSILICPDGSKDGWDESDAGDVRRDKFLAWLDTQRYEDGSSDLDWVEIRYSPDDCAAQIVHHAWSKDNE